MEVYPVSNLKNSFIRRNYLFLSILFLPFISKAETNSNVCAASFTYFVSSSNIFSINFVDNSSSTSGTINSYFWHFGDGNTSNLPNPIHVYSAIGNYAVFLFISTSAGCNDSVYQTVTINPPTGINITYFGADSSGSYFCTAPQTLQFVTYGAGYGYTVSDSLYIEVNYDDGNDTGFYTQTSQSYFNDYWFYTYTSAGTYYPRIIVTDPVGWSDTLIANPIIIANTCGSLSGSVYLDNNADCAFNSGDQRLEGINVSLIQNSIIISWTVTDSAGNYSFNVPTGQTYDVHVGTGHNWYAGNYTSICPSNATLTVSSIPSFGNDFFLSCPNGYDITGSLSGWGFVPGRTGTVCLFTYDQLCGNPAGQIKLLLDGSVTLIPDSNPLYTISGDTLIWNVSSNTNYSSYCIYVRTDSTAMIGDSICATLFMEPIAGDANPNDNVITRCWPVRTSYDPNDKSTSPEGEGLNHAIRPATELTYTIRFQNTGNAEAEKVVILDTLDANLDLNSYDVVAASHAMVPDIISGNVLRFTFNNINLPDSAENEPASHGYVTYHITPINGIVDGTVLMNTAGIYFDYNPAITTNTTQHTIDYTLQTTVIQSTNQFIHAYPVPASNFIRLDVEHKGEYILRITDALGRIKSSRNSSAASQEINISSFESGVYFIEVVSGMKIDQVKIIVR